MRGDDENPSDHPNNDSFSSGLSSHKNVMIIAKPADQKPPLVSFLIKTLNLYNFENVVSNFSKPYL